MKVSGASASPGGVSARPRKPVSKRHPLRQLREQLGMTQDELARRSGVDRVTIVKLETGSYTKQPRAATVAALCYGMGVRAEQLAFMLDCVPEGPPR